MTETKSPGMVTALDEITELFFGRTRSTAIKIGHCVTCGKEVTGFKDELSRKEYRISGMCQNCQDGTFDGTFGELAELD